MHLLSPLLILASSLLFLRPTSASPLILPRQTTTLEYYLRTRTTDPSSDKNGLYLYAYHTGAGLNDVVLNSNVTGASPAFLNDTYQLFDFGSAFPWGLSMGGNTNYAGEVTSIPFLVA